MPTYTVTGTAKFFYKGKVYRPGDSFEMTDHDYSQVKVVSETKVSDSEKKTKFKEKNERIS